MSLLRREENRGCFFMLLLLFLNNLRCLRIWLFQYCAVHLYDPPAAFQRNDGREQFGDVGARLRSVFSARSVDGRRPLHVERRSGWHRPLRPLSLVRSSGLRPAHRRRRRAAAVRALPRSERHAAVPAVSKERPRRRVRRSTVRRLFGLATRGRSQDLPLRSHRNAQRMNVSVVRARYAPSSKVGVYDLL